MLTNRWSVLALLFAVRTGMGVQYQAVAALSPLYMADLSLTVADIGLLIGLYHAPGIFLAFPGGAIGARLGDKRVVLIGLVLMIAGEVMVALSPEWSVQIAGRFLAGAGGIFLSVLMSKMVADWFADKEISTAMAIFGNAAPAGIGLALVTLPFIAGSGGRIWASAAIVLYLGAALCALALLYRAPRHAAPVARGQSLWPEPRAFRAVLAAGVTYGLYNVGLIVVFGFGPLMLAERGWPMAAASSTTSVVLWLVVLSLPAGGWLADRTGRSSTVLIWGLIGFAAALVLSTRVDAVLPAFILLGVLAGLPCGAIMSLPARVLSPETRFVGMGLFYTVYYFMNLSGPWLIGHAAKLTGSSQVAFDLGALFLGVGGLAWVVYRLLTRGLAAGQRAEAAG